MPRTARAAVVECGRALPTLQRLQLGINLLSVLTSGRYERSKGHRYERSDRTLRTGLLAVLLGASSYQELFRDQEPLLFSCFS